MIESLKVVRNTETPKDTPFPTLEVANYLKAVFGITPTIDNPLTMQSNPDFVIFPDIKLEGEFVYRCRGTILGTRKAVLAGRLRELGVEIESAEELPRFTSVMD